jgi:glycosyl transferase, family 25
MRFKTFLINMKRSPERLQFMSAQLGKLGIPFAVQEGIDGRTHDFGGIYDETLSMKANGAPLADVEKGCALSHRNILETVIAEDLEYALIMEDDVELPDDFKRILDAELIRHQAGQETWEYLAFNYPTVGYKFVKLWLFLLAEQFRKHPTAGLYLRIPLFAVKFAAIVLMSVFEGARDYMYRRLHVPGEPARFYRPMYLAGCYLVTRKGAEKLLRVQHKIIYPADRVHNVARVKYGLRLFWFVPRIVRQRRDRFESTMYENKDYVFEKYD